MGEFDVTFWGVRGAIPCPGQHRSACGGNTACVEVRILDRLIVLDAGSGIRDLGQRLTAEAGGLDLDLVLSHCHLDHVMGLPFFEPAYDPGARIRLWAGNLMPPLTLGEVVAQMMTPPLFPITPASFQAQMSYHDFRAGSALDFGAGLDVMTTPLHHPGGATGYRLQFGRKSLAYVTDHEHGNPTVETALAQLVKGCDLIIYDATYTPEEYEKRVGWGHSTWQHGVTLAQAAGAQRLALFHHEPSHDDAAMQAIERHAQAAFAGAFVAREGQRVAL